ncbi:MAG: helicase-related protein, partial [Planctomycetales bacterium]
TVPSYTPRSVAECYARDPQRWGKSIMFFHRLDQCLECQRLLAERGFGSEVVTAKTNRERQLADFADGKVDVLINMSILTEGFDCPSLKTAFCRPSGKGCTVQMGGRVFRRHPDIDFKQVVQCQKTRHPFVKTAVPEEQYVWSDGAWRTLKINSHLAAVSRNALKKIANTQVELPRLVMMNRPRKTPWGFAPN